MKNLYLQNYILYIALFFSGVYFLTFEVDYTLLIISLLLVQVKLHGISTFYHRLITHQSYKTNRWINRIGCTIATLMNEGSPFTWRAVHQLHHKYTDKKGDPHSPVIYPSFFKIFDLMASNDAYKNRVALRKNGVLDDYHIFLHHYGSFLLIALSVFIFLFFGFEEMVLLHLFPIALGNFFVTVSTITAHKKIFGSYRTYETDDHSQNNVFISTFCSAGEGMHNNHHKYAGRKRFGEKWWEIDTTAMIIKLIEVK
jgi:fatty-acid desaturase